MRHAILIMTLLGVSSCGGSAAEPSFLLSISQALSAEVSTIELASLDGSYGCDVLFPRQNEVHSAGICLGTDFTATPPCVISRAVLEVSTLDLSAPVSLFVPAGSRTLTALGFDQGGARVAFACAGPMAIEAGKKTDIELELK